MFKVDLYHLRQCKQELETESKRLERLIADLESIALEIRNNVDFDDIQNWLSSETGNLKSSSEKIQKYTESLGEIIRTYEIEEYTILTDSESLTEGLRVSRTVLRNIQYLDELLSGIRIR